MENNEDQLKQGTKESILKVAVDIINSGDMDKLTIRNVAALAGANVGAVNYHFGSKEQLIEAAFKLILKPFGKIYDILDSSEGTPRDRLREFLLNVANYSGDCPAPLKYYRNMEKTVPGPHMHLIKMFKTSMTEKLIKTLSEVTGEQNHDRLAIMALQVISSVIMPSIMLSEGSDLFKEKVPTPEEQVDILLERI